MIEPIVLESNQNHATITNTGICPTLSAGMGMGGGWIPMVVIGIDVYNQCTTGDVSKSLSSAATDADHIPCVMIEVDNEKKLVRRQWANTGSETSGNVWRS